VTVQLRLPTQVFPRRVTVDGQLEFALVKALVTDRRVVAYHAVGRQVELAFDRLYTALDARGATLVFTLEDGREMRLERAGGCGCHNPVKRFQIPVGEFV